MTKTNKAGSMKFVNNSLNEFIGSFDFDKRLAVYDVIGSIAHVKMLAKCRIVPSKDAQNIIKGLNSILKDLHAGKMVPKQEDIHYAVEKELIKRIGSVGGKMHTARSRNDQVALDVRMFARSEIREIIDILSCLQKSILKQAKENIDVVMPGYTHLQPAQPILFSHHILSYAWMFERDKGRLKDCLKRVNVLPLGSAALAGTSFNIDRNYTAKLLGFDNVSENSVDAVSDRDFVIELVSVLSIISMHLSRLAEELIIWSSSEFGFIQISDEYTSGSSIMPQKRNPDVAELVRGKTGRVYGSLVSLLTTMKSLPLAYNRDMQEDKPPFFEAVDTAKSTLNTTAEMLGEIKVNKKRLEEVLRKGYLEATELANYLVKKGMPFRQAHEKVQSVVTFCVENNKKLCELTAEELSLWDVDAGVIKQLTPKNVVLNNRSSGGTSLKSVKAQILKLKGLVK